MSGNRFRVLAAGATRRLRAVAGDLKLAYAQFEELETFARFGARLDEDTRKIIEHGRRIRACLKQQEGAPVSVSAQIAVLLALTAGLFDPVALAQMGMRNTQSKWLRKTSRQK